MKKSVLFICVLIALSACSSNEYRIHFDVLELNCFYGVIDTDSYDLKNSILTASDLANSEVVIITENEFDNESYIDYAENAMYNSYSMDEYFDDERYFKQTEGKNVGYLVVPEGSGVLTVYDSRAAKTVEIIYQNDYITSMKIWQNGQTLYEAEGLFDIGYVEGTPHYEYVSGNTKFYDFD